MNHDYSHLNPPAAPFPGILTWSVLFVLGVLGVILLFGWLGQPPGYQEWHDKRSRMADFCDTALTDSAPGPEKRQTRAMCDDFKQRLENERPR